jgi:hypothetical protein
MPPLAAAALQIRRGGAAAAAGAASPVRDGTLLTGCFSFRMQRLHLPKVPQGRHLIHTMRPVCKCRPCGTWQERVAGLSGSSRIRLIKCRPCGTLILACQWRIIYCLISLARRRLQPTSENRSKAPALLRLAKPESLRSAQAPACVAPSPSLGAVSSLRRK